MSTKELTEYLGYVKKLEARIYEQKNILYLLTKNVEKLKNMRYTPVKDTYNVDGEEIGACFWFILIGAISGLFIGLVYGVNQESGFILWRIFCCKIKYLVNGFLIGAVGGIIVTIISILYLIIDTKRKNKIIEEKNRQTIQNNSIKKSNDQIKIKIIKDEIDSINRQYQTTKNTLKKAYNLDILHPKYQNFIAVCSLHEYLVTGRCTQLTGHEGGYNIFEMEIRMNLIILKLDEVVNKLEQIQQNQYELYSALSVCNQNINRVCKQVSSVSSNLERIEQNQELLEYNSSVIANNTEFTKWMTYFRG